MNNAWLIVVEGIEVVSGAYYWWGGNLAAASHAPVRLSHPSQLVYSPHDYPASVHHQTWFQSADFPGNLPALWDRTWAGQGRPIILGEFGTFLRTDSDRRWLETLVSFIAERNLSFAFWSWNPNSGDTGGLVTDDWTTPQQDKLDFLRPLLPQASPPILPDHIGSDATASSVKATPVAEPEASEASEVECGLQMAVDDDWGSGCVVRGSFSFQHPGGSQRSTLPNQIEAKPRA